MRSIFGSTHAMESGKCPIARADGTNKRASTKLRNINQFTCQKK